MENFDQPITGMAAGKEDDLRITPEVRQYWKEIANWSLFFAILLFIIFGLIVIIGLLFSVAGLGGFVAGLLAIALYSTMTFFPGYFYYLFSSQLKKALQFDNTMLLDSAFLNLKRFYRYVGILLIVVFCLTLLFFLIFVSMAARGSLPD